ncbi:MAG: hypothetical protein PHS53_00375 [Candidatus Pacebacteria bacterium]|nr:hypothetical protein [Candidatus Paceibacterota bacterium]MDD5356592.1 hypothetical protein [Candidatus Paceibacterota bacterium]
MAIPINRQFLKGLRGLLMAVNIVALLIVAPFLLLILFRVDLLSSDSSSFVFYEKIVALLLILCSFGDLILVPLFLFLRGRGRLQGVVLEPAQKSMIILKGLFLIYFLSFFLGVFILLSTGFHH